MASILRFENPASLDRRRWFAGVAIRPRSGQVAAVVVAVGGRGLEASVDQVQSLTANPGREPFCSTVPVGSAPSVDSLLDLRQRVAKVVAEAVSDLLHRASLLPSRVVTLTVYDPGHWRLAQGIPSGCLSICDGYRVAELTGLNVVDDLPGRDLACGGQGGPLLTVAQWILLRDANRDEVLVDLGRTMRATFLPAMSRPDAAASLWAMDVGPGTAMLDLLAQRFSAGQQAFDPGGRIAVQGQCIAELLAHWLRDPVFDCPPPRWQPGGIRPERFLADAMQMAVRAGWSVRDLLCTATHLLAESLRITLLRRVPSDMALSRIVVAGGGQQNGFLLNEISRCCELPVVKAGELNPPGESLEAAAVALMGMLHVDQVPSSGPRLTGSELSRVLGQLTPGSPQHWQRLLQEMADAHPARRPLRSAL
ncbi:MAG: anhydro-N-acetylmuramic acid kinase [Planctomycetota bacterium]